jgi:hypothetical protein
MIGRMIAQWFSDFVSYMDRLISDMDMTQWGIVSVVFVIVGFMALRSRL